MSFTISQSRNSKILVREKKSEIVPRSPSEPKSFFKNSEVLGSFPPGTELSPPPWTKLLQRTKPFHELAAYIYVECIYVHFSILGFYSTFFSLV